MKIDLRTAASIRSNVQDKLLLLSLRLHTTTKEFGFNEEYHQSDKFYKYAVIPKTRINEHLWKSKEKEVKEEKEEEDDEPIPIHNYVSIKNPKNKFKKIVKKLIIAKRFPKNLITETSVKEHMNNLKNNETSNQINTPRNIKRMKMVTFASQMRQKTVGK